MTTGTKLHSIKLSDFVAYYTDHRVTNYKYILEWQIWFLISFCSLESRMCKRNFIRLSQVVFNLSC